MLINIIESIRPIKNTRKKYGYGRSTWIVTVLTPQIHQIRVLEWSECLLTLVPGLHSVEEHKFHSGVFAFPNPTGTLLTERMGSISQPDNTYLYWLIFDDYDYTIMIEIKECRSKFRCLIFLSIRVIEILFSWNKVRIYRSLCLNSPEFKKLFLNVYK